MAGSSAAAVGTIARKTATITGLNVLSRATGFVRVVATASALGIAALGDAYQRANLVSNILFELLAGGLLFSVLVPTFVAGLDRGRRDECGLSPACSSDGRSPPCRSSSWPASPSARC